MKAIVNVTPGRAEITDVPYPSLPNEGYIIVKPTAWAINPVDPWHVDLEGDASCAGCYAGSDYAGIVVEVGTGVTKSFVKGDRIAGWTRGHNQLRKTDGSFAEYVAVKGDAQMKVPDSLSDTDAATQGIAISIIGQSLYRDFQLPLPGKARSRSFVIFINGGSTAMGVTGTQFAKLSGGSVITTASPSNFDYLKSLGADHVFDYRSASLAEDVLAAAGKPLKYVLDACPSEASASLSAKLLSREGEARYASLLPGVAEMVKSLNPTVRTSFPLAYAALGEPWVFVTTHYEASPRDFEFQKELIEVAEGLFSQQKLQAPRVFLNRGGKGLSGVLHGMDEMRNGKVSGGKLVYTAE